MQRRRQFLAAGVAGISGVFGGCSCGETWASVDLAFDVTDVRRHDGEWHISVSATLSFDFPKEDDEGIGSFDIALYDRNKTLLEARAVDGFRWKEVPDSHRTETDCGDHGTASVTESFTVDRIPFFVGPRFHHGQSVDTLELDWRGSRSKLTASRLERDRSSKGNVTVTAVSADDYESVQVKTVPWPVVDSQTVDRTETFRTIRFDTSVRYRERDSPEVNFYSDATEIAIRWARPVPDGSCERPFLEGVDRQNRTLYLRIGTHDVPRVRCQHDSAIPYRFEADFRDATPPTIETIVFVHLDATGKVIERLVHDVHRRR